MSVVSAPAAIMRLTPRDRALVGALMELRYLTAPQIREVCYPGISLSSASHRLTLLRRRGLLDCLAHRTFSDRRAFWGLTSLGRTVGAALADAPPVPPRLFAVAALQMEHLIATNQVFCDLCLQHRGSRLGSFRWYGSHHACVDLGSTHLVPDAVILAAAPEGHWWMYCLELDRHTMALQALAEKFERYRVMRRIAALRREDPLWEARAECWILFACGEERRAVEAARLATAHGLDRVWAGTAGDLPESLSAVVPPSSEAAPAPPLGMIGGIEPPQAPCRLSLVRGQEGAS